jgi:hypothetical protein
MYQKLFGLFWQERIMFHKEKYFENTWILLILHWHSTQDGGCNQTEVLKGGAATYCRATIYHGHLIMVTNNHTDILSQRQFITPTFYLSDNLSHLHFITPTFYLSDNLSHRHFITPTFYLSDNLSHRHFISATIYHSDNLSQRHFITPTFYQTE